MSDDTTTGIVVHGSVADGFEGVRDEFRALLRRDGAPLSAQVAAFNRGRPVVDLWAGPDMRRDSLQGIYSASKGVTNLLVALLVQDGAIDLDAPVARYWPQFAAEGKGAVLVRELLSHQAGLVGAVDGFTVDELADDATVAERLGAQAPFWRPGHAAGYHALVLAALSGELVRRVTGTSVPHLFDERLREPLGLDLHLGLPEDQDARYLPAEPMIVTPERQAALDRVATAPDSLAGIAFNRHHPGNHEVWELPNLEVVRRRGPASLGGVGTARALAKLYAALVSPVDDHDRLLTPATVARMGQVQTHGVDLVLREPKSWAVGFHTYGETYPMLGQGAFGHSGAGGQQALVDPRHELSYAFLRRRFAFPPHVDPDHARLLRALRGAVDTST